MKGLRIMAPAAFLIPLLTFCCALAPPLVAEPVRPGDPYVFANLAGDEENAPLRLSGISAAAIGDLSLFTARDAFGWSLWRTDGTARGTFRVQELCPGPCHFMNFFTLRGIESRNLAFLRSFEDYYQGGERKIVNRLWRTDGTAKGTYVVASGPYDTFMDWYAWVSGKDVLVFTADTAQHGVELWASDGTEEGTTLLADLRPGPEGSDPYAFYEVDGEVFFTADDGVHGYELWRTDGTAKGTHRVTDLRAGARNSYAHVMGAVGDRLLLGAWYLDQGLALWSTDGTTAGTRLVQDIHPEGFGRFGAIDGDGDRVYILAASDATQHASDRHIWVSDGTPEGTRRLTPHPHDWKDLAGTGSGALGNGKLVFDWSAEGTGREVWVSDGTLESTRPLGDFCPGPCWSRPERPYIMEMQVHNGLAYFEVTDGVHGGEPWVSDGTEEGTRILLDSCPGDCDGMGGVFKKAGSEGVFFVAGPSGDRSLWFADGKVNPPIELIRGGLESLGKVHPLPDGSGYLLRITDEAHGTEPWVSDLTPAGTRLLRGSKARRGDTVSSDPQDLTLLEDRLFLKARIGDGGWRLWAGDTLSSSLEVIEELPPILAEAMDSEEGPILAASETHLFVATAGSVGDDTVTRAWSRRAGEPGWTKLPTLDGGGLDRAIPFGHRLLLVNRHLAVSDGTVEGTRIVMRDLRAHDGALSEPVVVAGGRAYFSAWHPDDLNVTSPSDRRRFLWRTDGTAEGTVALHLLSSGLWGQAMLGEGLLFQSNGKLWVLDGPGAAEARELALPPGADDALRLASLGDRAVFTTSEGKQLWITDGTVGGTREVELPGSEMRLTVLISLQGRVLVRGGRYNDSRWVWWSTDGTAEGTFLLPGLDLAGHEGYSAWPAGDVALLTGDKGPFDSVNLWVTDGTRRGTRRLALLEGAVTGAVRSGERVFFSAPHPHLGTELWAVHLDGSEGTTWRTCEPDDETLCLLNGRFQVQVQWRDPRSGREGTAGARPFPGSDRTGTFWFFNPENVELIVKQLDGRDVNDFFWTFYGALTDVEYWIDVTDMENGATQTFYNAPGEICGRGETEAFPQSWVTHRARLGEATVPGCEEPGSLCLQDGRFVLEVDWRDPRTGATGSGTAVPGTDRTGYFWFFRQDNVELVAKVLDGTPVNGHHWVFYGSLTDVEYDLWVTDVVSGETRRYHNPPGNVCGGADTAAF